jgi:REP element-mobilizing transposase RayT
MDRYWFFTWRTYGTWLPGGDGFVGYYHGNEGKRVIDHSPGESHTEAIPPLERYSHKVMTGEPVCLSGEQAVVLLRQFQETAAYRGWSLDAAAVLSNHVHLVFGVPGDPEPSDLLKSWKSYASRALNREGPQRIAPRWFADGGSKRPLRGELNRVGAIRYVRDQTGPLVVWLSPEATIVVESYPATPYPHDSAAPHPHQHPATYVASSQEAST